MKPITGQYECQHSSGVGLDYFTSRIDRIVLQANGRFVLTIQNQSRAMHAAHSLLKGEQATTAAPETRREGSYTRQNNLVMLRFDEGGLEEAHLAADESGLQVGPNFFNKVSDSTFIPPTQRIKKDVEDIAKGMKIASTLGGIAVKAAKTIQGTVQSMQGNEATAAPSTPPPPVTPRPAANPASPVPPPAPSPRPGAPPIISGAPPAPSPGYTEVLFCDQCGERAQKGKRFCNHCGARLA